MMILLEICAILLDYDEFCVILLKFKLCFDLKLLGKMIMNENCMKFN